MVKTILDFKIQHTIGFGISRFFIRKDAEMAVGKRHTKFYIFRLFILK